MNTEKPFLYKELTGEIIESACNAHNALGCGLLEKVHENSLGWELELKKRKVSLQKEFRVIINFARPKLEYERLVV